MYNFNPPLYEEDTITPTPLSKWGINVAKMRKKAFTRFTKNYVAATNEWPEFKQEFDYTMSIKQIEKSKQPAKAQHKGIKFTFFPGSKNFLKYFTLSHAD